MFLLVIIGFLLPWQTRYIFNNPVVQGAPWDFGVLSLFVSQAVIGLMLAYEFWKMRAEIISFFQKEKTKKQKIIFVSFGLLIVSQVIFSENRLLTIQWIAGLLLLCGLFYVLHKNKESQIPFVAAFTISLVLQALLAALQVFVGGTFASTLLGVSLHRAADAGTAVIEYGGARYLRAYGGQPHPNIFGGLTLIGLILFNWMLKYKKTLGVKKNIVQYSLLIAGALFFSFSRAAWIGLGLWMALLISERKNLRESQLLMVRYMVSVFAVLLVIFFPLVMTRATGSSRIEQKSIEERASGLSTWSGIVKNAPLFGTGLGAYTTKIDSYGYAKVPVHSAPLLIFAEIGFFGLALLIVVAFVLKEQLKKILVIGVLPLIPIVIFDHYLVSLWAGQVILGLFIFQLFEGEKLDN